MTDHKVLQVQHWRQAMDGVGLDAQHLQPLCMPSKPCEQHRECDCILSPAPGQVKICERDRGILVHGRERAC